MNKYQETVLDALVEKVEKEKEEKELLRYCSSMQFDFLSSLPKEQQLEYAKSVYLNAFNVDQWGIDSRIFRSAINALEPLYEQFYEEDKEHALAIHDYIYRLEGYEQQIKNVGTIYNHCLYLGIEPDTYDD